MRSGEYSIAVKGVRFSTFRNRVVEDIEVDDVFDTFEYTIVLVCVNVVIIGIVM